MSRRERNEVELDPATEAELRALEAVLAGDPPTGALEEELAGLVREVRADAPSMPLALRERLDRSVSEGFVGNRGRARFPKITLGRALTGMAGLAAVAVVLVVVGVGQVNTYKDDSLRVTDKATKADSAASTAAPASVAPDAGTGSDSAAATGSVTAKSTATPSPSAPGTTRKVERAVELSLSVGLGKLQDASDGVVRVTQGVGGYVQDSQVSARGSRGDAVFTLRVPTARLDDAIAQLSKLGHVASLDQSSKDITSAFTSVGERLSDARAERRALIRALGKAQTSGEIASLRERIRGNRADLATLTAELNRLRSRSDMATIAVTVTARRGAAASDGGSGGGWTPGDAAHDALRVLEVVAGVLIVAAAILVPVGLLVLLTLVLGRGARRRRREHALDGAA